MPGVKDATLLVTIEQRYWWFQGPLTYRYANVDPFVWVELERVISFLSFFFWGGGGECNGRTTGSHDSWQFEWGCISFVLHLIWCEFAEHFSCGPRKMSPFLFRVLPLKCYSSSKLIATVFSVFESMLLFLISLTALSRIKQLVIERTKQASDQVCWCQSFCKVWFGYSSSCSTIVFWTFLAKPF